MTFAKTIVNVGIFIATITTILYLVRLNAIKLEYPEKNFPKPNKLELQIHDFNQNDSIEVTLYDKTKNQG